MSYEPGSFDGHFTFSRKKSVVPLPPDLLLLPTIKPEPWLLVDSEPDALLEGPSFDREGNLYVTCPLKGKIYKITPQKQISTIFNAKGVGVDGSAFHKDGRLFVACITGELLVINPDGSNITYLYPKYQGKKLSMNDLVFDSNGNIYVTDFTGSIMEPTGGVYRISSDATVVKLVLQHMAAPNGISLSPEGDVLWVAETTRNTIIRICVQSDGISLVPIDGANCVYYSSGGPGGPDSNKVDVAGNLYQCIIFQGRAIVFNNRGIPIANILIPGRDEGKHLLTANLAFKPTTNEAYITASGEGGGWLYKFKGLAKGLTLFSHR